MTERPVYIEEEGWRLSIKESHNRRLLGHDYSAPGVYMLTLVTEGRMPVFGEIEGDIRAERLSEHWPHLVPSPLGEAVLNEEANKISEIYPMVELWRIAVMPDHIHMIIYIRHALPKGKSLGNIVAGFKGGCSRAWWRLQEEGRMPFVADATNTRATPVQAAAPVQAASAACPPSRPSLFSPGYNDRILKNSKQLQIWKDYLIDNPYRLLVRRTLPSHFQRYLDIKIGGKTFSAFGNFFLLKKPEKLQVFCHRKARYSQLTEKEKKEHNITYLALPDTPTGVPYIDTEAFQKERDYLLDAAFSGIPLVTPGISEGEKDIMNSCIRLGLPLIHIQEKKINDLWKPEKTRFDACAAGNLLILIPKEDILDSDSKYTKFHNMNDLAYMICSLDTQSTLFKTRIKSNNN